MYIYSRLIIVTGSTASRGVGPEAERPHRGLLWRLVPLPARCLLAVSGKHRTHRMGSASKPRAQRIGFTPPKVQVMFIVCYSYIYIS